MSFRTPPLFALPRELRNKIYSHLTHPLSFTWLCKHGHGGLPHTICARVPHAPYPDLLLVCMRLNAEYRDTTIFKDLELVLDGCSLISTYSRPESKRGAVTGHWIFTRIRHVTLYIEYTATYSLSWKMWKGFFRELETKAAKMASIRVALYSQMMRIAFAGLDLSKTVTVMRRSGSRVPRSGGLVLLPRLIKYLLPQLYHRYVM
ncbi:hypothetical protein CC86DRAFT_373771 [Ophiobolus disseminans]|uniref:F-box domain-containing protein n=1 Tax=Ophiobolus disseminans TaxID=1469910 RepID=A0A6A6ZKZ2_9PLEO|nr:hypothetical protein CC86DRAFT_373771 [Ophiobolus disseminans]